MKVVDLMYALNHVGSDFVEEAEFSKIENMQKKKKYTGMSRRFISILVAACLVLALGVTALATEWFGFSTRLTPAPPILEDIEIAPEYGDPSDHHYFSYSGAMDSDVMKASLEWQDYVNACRETEEYQAAASNDAYFAYIAARPDLKPYCDIYDAVTEEMADQLFAIAENYGIRLHNEATTPENNDQFHQLAGTRPFILHEDGSYEFQCYLVYEDGSYRGAGFVPVDGNGCSFSIVRSKNDVLDPTIQEIYGSEQYEEWQYTTKTGALVSIASWDWGHPENGKSLTWVFYKDDENIITMHGTTPLDRESCEAFADSFDFMAAVGKD